MEEKATIAKNIAALIKSSGKTNTQIALEIGLSKNVITEYVSGRSLPNLLTLRKLCQIFDCNYEDILGRLE